MEKQYSVQFFTSFIDSLQDVCRKYLQYSQFVEVSGYVSVEIDNMKKERYVLSELLQSSGNVVSESYCTKAFKTSRPLNSSEQARSRPWNGTGRQATQGGRENQPQNQSRRRSWTDSTGQESHGAPKVRRSSEVIEILDDPPKTKRTPNTSPAQYQKQGANIQQGQRRAGPGGPTRGPPPQNQGFRDSRQQIPPQRQQRQGSTMPRPNFNPAMIPGQEFQQRSFNPGPRQQPRDQGFGRGLAQKDQNMSNLSNPQMSMPQQGNIEQFNVRRPPPVSAYNPQQNVLNPSAPITATAYNPPQNIMNPSVSTTSTAYNPPQSIMNPMSTSYPSPNVVNPATSTSFPSHSTLPNNLNPSNQTSLPAYNSQIVNPPSQTSVPAYNPPNANPLTQTSVPAYNTPNCNPPTQTSLPAYTGNTPNGNPPTQTSVPAYKTPNANPPTQTSVPAYNPQNTSPAISTPINIKSEYATVSSAASSCALSSQTSSLLPNFQSPTSVTSVPQSTNQPSSSVNSKYFAPITNYPQAETTSSGTEAASSSTEVQELAKVIKSEPVTSEVPVSVVFDEDEIIDLDLIEDEPENVQSNPSGHSKDDQSALAQDYGMPGQENQRKEVQMNPRSRQVVMYAVKLFKGYIFRKTGVEIDPLAIAPAQLDGMLLDFFQGARKMNGEELNARTLKNVQTHLDMFFREQGYSHSISKDDVFQASRDFVKRRLDNMASVKYVPVDDNDIEILFQKGVLGSHSPEALFNTMWFMNTKYFGLRRPSEHYNLKWGDIQLLYTATGQEYLERKVTETFSLKVFAKMENPQRCYVNFYKTFTSLRQTEMRSSFSAFYLNHAKGQKLPNLNCWFSNEAMACSRFQNMGKRLVAVGGLDPNKKI